MFASNILSKSDSAVIVYVYLRLEGWHSTPMYFFGHVLFFFRSIPDWLRNAKCVRVCVCVSGLVESRVEFRGKSCGGASKAGKHCFFCVKIVAVTNHLFWLSTLSFYLIHLMTDTQHRTTIKQSNATYHSTYSLILNVCPLIYFYMKYINNAIQKIQL